MGVRSKVAQYVWVTRRYADTPILPVPNIWEFRITRSAPGSSYPPCPPCDVPLSLKSVPCGRLRAEDQSEKMGNLKISRREFVSRVAVLTGGLTAGLRVDRAAASEKPNGNPLRVVFATDSHLMVNNQLRSEDGLRAALGAIESLTPKPDLILFGGDLTHESPILDFPAAEQLIDRFLKIWKDHTDLPSFFTFGNHDLVGTKNASVSREDPRFGKGLYRMRLALERDFYAFRKNGWRFIVLDDVLPEPDGSYVGEFPEEQLAFLRAELQTDSQMPTVICGHIPSVSVLPSLGICGETKTNGATIETPAALVTRNASVLHHVFNETKANVKLVLAGHLHHLEQIQIDGISYLNGGAICGNWWKGAQMGCPEGFLVLELNRDGTVQSEYRSYGWKASAA
jgi:Icc protein